MHPILFRFKSLTFYSYGFFLALAFLTVYFLAEKRAARRGFPPSLVTNLILIFFAAGLIGARAYFVWLHAEEYRRDPLSVFYLQQGGLVWYGGFMAAVLAGMFYAWSNKAPLVKLCDFFAPLLPLAQAIGRVGCFLNGCCYGLPNGLHSRHPVQLYESVSLLVLSLVLFDASFRKHRDGELFLAYLILASAVRFWTEFLRGDQTPVAFFTLPQWTSLFLFFGALALFLALRKRQVSS
jgi:phosphatidylglycerol:prolipoprotein diacylglycerol transferase